MLLAKWLDEKKNAAAASKLQHITFLLLGLDMVCKMFIYKWLQSCIIYGFVTNM